MLQDVMQLRKLLLTGYKFSSILIPIEYGVRVTRCSISSFVTAGLWPRRRGLDTGVVAFVKHKVVHYIREDRVKVS